MSSDEKNTCELRETVRQLNAALSTTKETVQQLKDALGARESEIARLRQMLTQTKKERDELRQQNAGLISKLAFVGRKQSTSSPPKLRSSQSSQSLESPTTSSPSPHHTSFHPQSSVRSRTLSISDSPRLDPLPPLPPPPPPETNTDETETPADEESDTEYSDIMENDNSTEVTSQRKMSQPKPITRNTGKPRTEPSGKIVSPKRSVTFPPNQGLSSITEEDGSPRQNKHRGNTGKERLPSDSGFEGSPVFISSVSVSSENDSPMTPRRRVTMSVTDFKKHRSLSEDAADEVEDTPPLIKKDTPSKMDTLELRSRTSTIGTSYYKERGRKNSKQLKQEAAKLERSQNFRPGERKLQALELFSPDMELRIHEKICSGIGKKYGGLAHVTQAAIVIQTAYRQYKLKKRYDEIRKEAIQVRRRAQTMDPRRRPSMLRQKRPMKYQRQLTALAQNDPLIKTKMVSQELGRESIPHTSSRRELVEKKRNERSKSADTKPEDTTSPDENGVVEMDTVVVEMDLKEDNEVPPGSKVTDDGADATDSSGIPSSFSADVLLTSSGYQRPLSIFSVRPSSMMDTTQLPSSGHVTDNEHHVIQVMTQRPLPSEMRVKKMNIGIGHFNRKPTRGIQYLVKAKIIPDNPQKVATFLAKQSGLSKEKIGEFVGEINSEFHMAVLECLLEQMDMKDKPIDEALRDFQILFRMPGEAQKIDKIMQMFALEYYRFNKERVIKSEDAAYIHSFAIMMLHTSLHNPSVKNRTTKKQWVSMNRGCNDDENFPESFLLDIYDRISKKEFITGEDHTNIVSDIERNLIGYHNSSRLAIPQRKLICRASVTEIDQLTSRPSFNRNKRKRRIIFIFNDQVIICKRRGGDQLEYRGSFSLMDAIAISFETHYYKNGIQIYSSHDEKAIFQCCCDTNDDRRTLLHTLESTISELRELEKERIAELGTSMTKSQEIEPERRRRMASRAGDLLSSSQLNKATGGSVRGRRENKGDYVSGVGDLVISSTTTTIIRRTSKSSGTSSQPENRTSGGSHESGYDSQRTTPVPSPSPTNPPHSTPQQPPSVTIPPSSSSSSYIPKRPLQGRQSTTSAPMTLMTPAIPVTRSRSTDQIHLTRVMTITPTLNRETKMRFSSVEDVRGNRSPKSSSASNSPRISKKKDRTRSSEKKGLFSLSPFHRGKRRGSSPVVEKRSVTNNRPLTMSETPSPPPSSDLELCTRSVTTRASSYLVNTT